METATFGAGCFWGVEETFRKLPGVNETAVGYSGGSVAKPSYYDVCRGDTGHAEVVQISFDPKTISYNELLNVFWQCHNPTQLDRQGADSGRQYRSVIFYHNAEQKKLAQASKLALQNSDKYDQPVVTEISPAAPFYKAEESHQKYVLKQQHSDARIWSDESESDTTKHKDD